MADNDRERMEKEFEDRLTWKMGDLILIHPGYGPKTFAEMEAEEIAQEEANATGPRRDIVSAATFQSTFQRFDVACQPTPPDSSPVVPRVGNCKPQGPRSDEHREINPGCDRQRHRASHPRIDFHEHGPTMLIAAELHHRAAFELHGAHKALGRFDNVGQGRDAFAED